VMTIRTDTWFLLYDCFFFSSRRRHTRSKRDWSSDVCSSDLIAPSKRQPCCSNVPTILPVKDGQRGAQRRCCTSPERLSNRASGKIGRASCREREQGQEIEECADGIREIMYAQMDLNNV